MRFWDWDEEREQWLEHLHLFERCVCLPGGRRGCKVLLELLNRCTSFSLIVDLSVYREMRDNIVTMKSEGFLCDLLEKHGARPSLSGVGWARQNWHNLQSVSDTKWSSYPSWKRKIVYLCSTRCCFESSRGVTSVAGISSSNTKIGLKKKNTEQLR